MLGVIEGRDDDLQTGTTRSSMEKQLILPHLMRRGIDEMPNEREWMVSGANGSSRIVKMFKMTAGSLTRPKHTSDPPPESKTGTKRALRAPEYHDP